MTQRDYELLADAIRTSYEGHISTPEGVEERIRILEALCVAFKRDNPNFVRGVFLHRVLGYVPELASIDYLTEEANSR
jgi:hypothetical protein